MVPSSMRVLDVVGAWARWLLGECFFLFEFVVFFSKIKKHLWWERYTYDVQVPGATPCGEVTCGTCGTCGSSTRRRPAGMYEPTG